MQETYTRLTSTIAADATAPLYWFAPILMAVSRAGKSVVRDVERIEAPVCAFVIVMVMVDEAPGGQVIRMLKPEVVSRVMPVIAVFDADPDPSL